MPTKEIFEQYPPFPENVPVLSIPRLSYAKLFKNDPIESQALWDAATDHGFFLMDFSDSPGGPQMMKDATQVFDIARRFFDQPLEEKKKYPLGSGNIGYKPMGMIKMKDGRGDLTEMCSVPRDELLKADGSVPAVYSENRGFLGGVVRSLHGVTLTVLSQLARHLELPGDAFDGVHDPERHSVTVLRCLHYPPQPGEEEEKEEEQSSTGEGGSGGGRQVSLLGHTDNGTLTVLFTAIGGLQVLPSGLPDEPANWAWVRPEPNCAVVNVGDSLVKWTGGVLSSGFHRVLHPPGDQARCDRYSFGYFLKPAEAASMARFKGGKVPELTADEAEADLHVGTYDTWHSQKSKSIMKGENKVYGGDRKAK